MRKIYEIDYHSRDIRRQLSEIIDNDSVVEMMDVTIRFMTEMLTTGNCRCNDAGVVLSHEDNHLELVFRCDIASYDHLMHEIYLENEVRQFFESFYDKIDHKCSYEECSFVFHLMLLPEHEMIEKYFNALDKKGKNK